MKNRIYLKFEEDFKGTDEVQKLYNYQKLMEQTGYKQGQFQHLLKKINANQDHKYTVRASLADNTIEVTRAISSLDGLSPALLKGLGFVQGHGMVVVVSKQLGTNEKVYDWKHATLPLYLFLGKNNWFYDGRNHKWVHPDQVTKTIFLLENTPDVQVPLPQEEPKEMKMLIISNQYSDEQKKNLLASVEGTDTKSIIVEDYTGKDLDNLSVVTMQGVPTYAVLSTFSKLNIRQFLTRIIDAERFNDDNFSSTFEATPEQMQEVQPTLDYLQNEGWAIIHLNGPKFTASIGPRLRDAINMELILKEVNKA